MRAAILLPLLAALLVGAQARSLRADVLAPAPAPSTVEDVELAELAAQFDIWNAALQTGDSSEVAALYAPDGVLLPTVSNLPRTDEELKIDYFDYFLKLKPVGSIDESFVRFLTPERDVGINSGIYTFDVEKDGKPSKVQARYTFVYKKIDGEWKITEHHSSAMPEPTGDADEELKELEGLFEQWNAALQTGDSEKVADMYAEESVLLPTVSNEPRTDRAGKVDYFNKFLKLKPFGTINESFVRFLTPMRDVGINSGIYTFDIVQDGEPAKVQARYTYVYKKIDGEWKITEHHSSAMPEPVDA